MTAFENLNSPHEKTKMISNKSSQVDETTIRIITSIRKQLVK